MNYENQKTWKRIMSVLPNEYHFNHDYKPEESYWRWNKHDIHLDRFINVEAKAKIICFHGVGTNGRQISMITGGPQFKNGYETIMIDMPTYGVTKTFDRNTVTYDEWVQIGSDYIDYELSKDNRPIFLYGLSAGGMETFHVASRNKNVSGIIGMTFLDQRQKNVRLETTRNWFMGAVAVPLLPLFCKIGFGKFTMPMSLASKMSTLVNDRRVLKWFLKDKSSAGNVASMTFLNSYMNYVPEMEPEHFDVCPILLTQPEQDKWTPLHLSEPTLDKIKKVSVSIKNLPYGGHYPIEAIALETMNKEIDRFIKNCLS